MVGEKQQQKLGRNSGIPGLVETPQGHWKEFTLPNNIHGQPKPLIMKIIKDEY
jgi:hypothetical protein